MSQVIFLDGRLEDRLLDVFFKPMNIIFADLPYVSGTRNAYNTPVDLDTFWDYVPRVLADRGVVLLTADAAFAYELRLSHELWAKRAGQKSWFKGKYYWKKNKATGGTNADKQPMRNVEEVLVFYPKQPWYTPQMTIGHKPMNNCIRIARETDTYGSFKHHKNARAGKTDRFPTQFLDFPVVNNDDPDRIHAAQKPLPLIEFFCRTYGGPGMQLLDVSSGSASSAIAALNCEMDAVMIESDPVMMGKSIIRTAKHHPDAELYRQ